jgi:uncharacterized protein YqjF (DUF2071 family)
MCGSISGPVTAISASSASSDFLTAEWRDLVMINYEVAPEMLASRVPAGTALDLCQGRAVVSAVGFQFLNTRVRGIAVPFHRDFDEVNLRFYVRRQVGDEVRHGVVFISELVAPVFVALIARLAYNEPYAIASVRRVATAVGRIEYAWPRGRIGGSAEGGLSLPAIDSEAAFVTQRHWGYTRQRDGSTVEYHVAHPPWRVCQARHAIFDTDVASMVTAREPISAYLVDGSAVQVSEPRHHLVARGTGDGHGH